jgi:hypothetical protein
VKDDERPLPALRLADRLENLQRGEMIAIRPDGRVMDRRGLRLRYAGYLGVVGAFCTAAIAMSPAIGLMYTAMAGGMVALQLRRVSALNRIPRLVRAERLDEAEREIAALERRGWRYRAMAALGRCQIACHRGDLAAALTAARRCEQLLPAPDRRIYTVYWANQFLLASVLLELGKLDEAQVAIGNAMRAPDGEYYAVLKRELEALRAFIHDRADDLGTDDDLHDRVRVALRHNHTGMTVGLLAWAYDRRGDVEMSAHLIAEAPARFLLGPELVEKMHPRVWAWLGPRIAALPAPEEE